MKTYAILAILFLCALNAVGQSCPQTATIDGQQFSVVQLGNQCFYLDTRSEYLDGALTTLIGSTTDLPNLPTLGISNVTARLTDYAFSNYQYSFLLQGCTPTERISADLVIGLEVEFSILGIPTDATGTVSANVTIETSYSIGLSETPQPGTTFLQLEALDVGAGNIDVDGNIPFLDALAIIIDNDFLRGLLLDPLISNFDVPTGSPTIRKVNDQIIPSNSGVAIVGPPSICGEPIILTATPGFTSYLWSTGSNASSIVVDEPGTYSVEVTDNLCNIKEASITITQSNIVDFIMVEPLCTGNVKLSAEGFASVQWSTGSESSFIEVDQSGSYSAEATDQGGCAGDDKVNITIGPCQPSNTVAALNVTAVCSDFPNLLRRWKITNPNSTPIRMDWEIAGTIQKTWLDVPPGDSYLSSITVPLNQNLLKVYWHDEKGQIKTLQQASTTSRCQKGANSSSIAASNGRFESELKVFPNPANDQFVLEIPSDDDQTVPLQILSASGVVWYTGTIQLSKGQNFISNDISRFDNGAYVIKLGSETIRFMKE